MVLYKQVTAIALFLLIVLGCGRVQAQILSLEEERFVAMEDLVEDLKDARVIFIGENHDNLHHHEAQLEIIRALRRKRVDLAIGLEMFRADSQETLDLWVKNKILFQDFMTVYRDNWNWWDKYRDLFNYARRQKVPMVGLNLSRAIITKVARDGFDALSEKEKENLPVANCLIDDDYRDFIRRSLNSHNQKKGNDFEHFCEAQLLWDTVMAKNIGAYLVAHPRKKVVILAGNGHAWKHGIPDQLRNNGEISWRVILPEVPGHIQQGWVSFKDADYLLIGASTGPFHRDDLEDY